MNRTQNLTLSAMFLALGMVLPFLTGQLQEIGNMLSPMHIPVLLCGLICGWQYGLAVGFIMPLLRYMIFGMPVLFPNGISMAFELATYGGLIGFLYGRSKWKCIKALYIRLVITMLAGRVVWAIARIVILGVWKVPFTFKIFVTQAFINAIPAIILQLILIPSIMIALKRTHLMGYRENN